MAGTVGNLKRSKATNRGGWRGNKNSLKNLAQPRKRGGMSIFDGSSNLLTAGYVYYSSMGDKESSPAAHELYAKASTYFGTATRQGSLDDVMSFNNLGKYLFTMAERERAKEIKSIKSLGLDFVSFDKIYNDESDNYQLLKDWNVLLQTRDAFERNVKRIQTKNGGKQLYNKDGTEKKGQNNILATDFLMSQGGYLYKRLMEKFNSSRFQESLQQSINIVIDGVIESITKQNEQSFWKDVEKKVQEYLSKRVSDILKEAILEMLDSATFKNGNDAEELSALYDLKESINKSFNSQDSFLQEVYENLHLDRIVKAITEEITNQANSTQTGKKNRVNQAYTKVKKLSGEQVIGLINTDFSRAKGLNAESFARLGANVSVKKMESLQKEVNNPNLNWGFHAYTTKGSEAKPDMIFTFGINVSRNGIKKVLDEFGWVTGETESRADTFGGVIEQMKENKSTSRSENVAWIYEANKKLEKLRDGFVIYTSNKEYGLNPSEGQFGGFSSGSNITLQNYWEIHREARMGQKAAMLVTTIENGMKGAMYEGHTDQLRNMLAADIAHFLFDDFKTIGDQIATWGNEDGSVGYGGAAALHMMYLDGVYVPFSTFLFMLAKAFSSADKNEISRLVQPYLSNLGSKKYQPGDDIGMDKWRDQRNTALTSIKVGAHFMKGFRDFINNIKI